MADITAGKGSLHLSVIDPEFQEVGTKIEPNVMVYITT